MTFKFNDSIFDPEDFSNEIVIINTVTGSYYTISGSATFVLRWFFRPITSDAVNNLIQSTFPSEISEATSFVDWLKHQDLIIHVESSHVNLDVEHSTTESNSVIHNEWTYSRFDDMADLIRLDPIHDVSDKGWPHRKP